MVTFWVDRMPIALAAPKDRSSVRPEVKGPRSFTRTETVLPILGFPTRRQVPKGNDLCAAVNPFALKASPDAVRLLVSIPCRPDLGGMCGDRERHKNQRSRHDTIHHGFSLLCGRLPTDGRQS